MGSYKGPRSPGVIEVLRTTRQSAILITIVALFELSYVAASPPGDVLGRVAFGVIPLGAALLLARACVVVSRAGVEVRNPLRRRFVPWVSIRSFGFQPILGLPGTACVRLVDGKAIRIWGIQRSGLRRDPALALVVRLTDVLGTMGERRAPPT
jgi:hypothetical protein